MSGEAHVLAVDVYAERVEGDRAAVRYEVRHPSGRELAPGEAESYLAPMGAAARDDVEAGEVARVTVRPGCAEIHDGPCSLAISLMVAGDVDLAALAASLATVVADLRQRAGVSALVHDLGQVEHLAEVMHDAYEAAATGFGWKTQAASAVPWAQVPEANRAATRAGLRAVLALVLP